LVQVLVKGSSVIIFYGKNNKVMDNSGKEKWIELARKLKELSIKGVDGEKINAQDKLLLIMRKYGITEQDISGNERKDFEFNIHKEVPNKFISQILSSVVGKRVKYGCEFGQFKYVKKPNHISYFIENIEPHLFSEFMVKLDLFWKHYKSELEIFYEAFVQKNKLYSKPTDDKDDQDEKPLTKEEKEKIWKMLNMMEGISSVTHHKQIDK